MKSLDFMMAVLGLLSMMMLAASTTGTVDIAVYNASATLNPVDEQTPSPPIAREDVPPGPGASFLDYNTRNPDYRIPVYVLCPRDGNILQAESAGWPGGRQNPESGGNAEEYMFSDYEVWNAFRHGWQHLMDAGAAGGYSPDTIPVFSSANQRYIQHAQDHWPMWEPGTRFPQEITGDVWDNVFDRAGWRVEPNWETTRIFSYPLTYQGRFDGGNSAGPNARVRVIAPGEYRVIFTATGLYLGAVRLRPGLPSLYQVFDRYTPRIALRASWMAPVDSSRRPIAYRLVAGGWNYPGVPVWPSQIPVNFLEPHNVMLATDAMVRWAGLGGSTPPPSRFQNMTDAPVEPRLQQLHNGTLYIPGDEILPAGATVDHQGIYYFDWNITTDNTTDPPAEAISNMGCDTGLQVVNRSYQVSCESNWDSGSRFLNYHIAVTGTGQGGYQASGWCKSITDNIVRYCGGNFNPVGLMACSANNVTTFTFFTDMDPNNGPFVNYVRGIEMWFFLVWPWAASDSNHECIAKAIQRGSCASRGMTPIYPVVCRNKKWFDLELSEWDWGNLGQA